MHFWIEECITRRLVCFQDKFKIQAGGRPSSKERLVFLFSYCLLLTKRERERDSYTIKDKLMVGVASVWSGCGFEREREREGERERGREGGREGGRERERNRGRDRGREVKRVSSTPQLDRVSVVQDMDSQRRNLIIYDMQSGTKFVLTAAKSSVRDQWLKETRKLMKVLHTYVYTY